VFSFFTLVAIPSFQRRFRTFGWAFGLRHHAFHAGAK
jgi:hypothetical protein